MQARIPATHLSLSPKHIRSSPAVSLISASLLLALASSASALINPNFTPVNLTKEAAAIAVVEVSRSAGGISGVRELEVLKGKSPGITKLEIDASDAVAQEEFVAGIGDREKVTGVVLTGDFSKAGGSGGDAPDAMLQVGTKWLALTKPAKADAGWALMEDPSDLAATWAGSSEMLADMARYILADSRAEIPTHARARVGGMTSLGTADPKARGFEIITNGKSTSVWIASPDGDQLIKLKNGVAEDGGKKLDSRTASGAWGDFNSDGIADLASWDGTKLSVLTGDANGEFAVAEIAEGPTACDEVVAAGKSMVTRSGDALTLWTLDSSGAWKGTAIKGGMAGTTVSADFDGNGIPDLVQVSKGRAIFLGGGTEGFKEPIETVLAKLGSINGLEIADFNGDRLLDLVTSSASGPRILLNRGEGRFEYIGEAMGELDYHSREQGATSAVGVGDFNHDGWVDVVAFYDKKNLPPLFFFNRGFGSFGFAREMPMGQAAAPVLAQIVEQGLRDGALADLNDDGALEVLALLGDGSLKVVKLNPELVDSPGLKISLAAGTKGPVLVTAMDGPRNLGSRLLRAGQPAYFWIQEPGPVELKWLGPDGKEGSAETGVEQPNTPFEIPHGN